MGEVESRVSPNSSDDSLGQAAFDVCFFGFIAVMLNAYNVTYMIN